MPRWRAPDLTAEERATLDALDAAREIPGAIDALYVGPDTDAGAIDFMKRLGRVGGGTVIVKDLMKCRSIVAPLRGLLGLPAPK